MHNFSMKDSYVGIVIIIWLPVWIVPEDSQGITTSLPYVCLKKMKAGYSNPKHNLLPQVGNPEQGQQ